MDCSLLIGEQLTALERLANSLHSGGGQARALLAWRELRDRASAHVQVREQVLLPVLRQRGWKGLNSEALAAHMDFKRVLAALCICTPGESDFAATLGMFRKALAQQRQADALWIVPTLRRLTSVVERREMCEEMERLREALVPPPEHYMAAEPDGPPGSALVQSAALVLNSLAAG